METPSAKHFRFSEFELDVSKRLLLRNGEPVSLNPKALDLLSVLIASHGDVVSKDTLLERVWPGQIVEEGNLKVHISALRKAFGQSGNEHRFIVTVPGRGYCFVAELDPETRGSNVDVNSETTEYGAADTAHVTTGKLEPLSRPSTNKWKLIVAVIILILVVTGLGYWLNSPSPSNPVAIESIAVMPFVNENGNSDIEYLSDGMTETLINGLSQLPSLSVKARSSVFLYKGKATTAKQLGSDLDVQAVLFGRFIQHGDDLTLFLSLVDTRSENQVWGKQYVRKLDNVLALQSEIARDVSESLRSKLSGSEKQKLAQNRTDNEEAYNLYLRGRFYWNKFTGDSIQSAIKYFEQAIEKDHRYAAAYCGLASSYIVLGVNGHIPVVDARPKARAAAETAIALDDQLAEAHLVSGANKLFFDLDLDGSEREFKISMELDPSNAGAHELYSYVLRSRKRFDEAITEAKKAHDLDPLDLVIYEDIASAYRLAGRLTEAVEVNNKVIETDPSFADVRFENAVSHSLLGHHEIAVAEIKRGLVLSDNSTHFKAGLGVILARAGKKASAQKVIDELMAESSQRYVSPLDIAAFYSVMGEREKAFEWLEKAYSEPAPWLIELNVNHDWEPIRDDPRFLKMLRNLGL